MQRIGIGLVAVVLSTSVVLGFEADKRYKQPERLDVTGTFSHDRGHLTSKTKLKDGTSVLHGLQVILGPENKMLECAVFNQGNLESRTQYYPNGLVFRQQQRLHDGTGYEIVSTPERTKVIAEKVIVASGEDIGRIKMQEEICRGTIKDDRMWEGEFLRWEQIPNTFGLDLMKQSYKEGKLVESTPFDEKQLKLPPDPSNLTDSAAWPWKWRHHTDEWPKPKSGR